MAIEKGFDVEFIAALALREKQIQQNYRPIIAVHKWFARRPGTLFRGLILSEFVAKPLRQSFFESNDLKGTVLADPFMGGGTPLIEANRMGCSIIGFDINPMAYWIVKQEIEHLNLNEYLDSGRNLLGWLEQRVGHLYRTRCVICHSKEARVKYFLWVKVQPCLHCNVEISLFPGYLIAEDRRHPQNVFVCPKCEELNETSDRKRPGKCNACGSVLQFSGPAKSNHILCDRCGSVNSYPLGNEGPPRHRMFALEYFCTRCKSHHKGRFFKKVDEEDLSKYRLTQQLWDEQAPHLVPDDEIPKGDETMRLHRWGYRKYQEMFNARQLLGLELSCRAICRVGNERVRNALATNLSDLLRYQNMLCRYDTMALKSLDIFSIHGFPIGLVQCESNLLGISGEDGINVGSGGWSNIISKYVRAKKYCQRPFEVDYRGGRKVQVPIPGEWIGDRSNGVESLSDRQVILHCQSSTSVNLPPGSLDAVFTDPPYFGNVQYAELMDFCYVWLRRLVGGEHPAFKCSSTRNPDELTGNVTMDRDLEHFTAGLSEAFQQMAQALKPGAPFAFTYHHNRLEAYSPLGVAILGAGLTCSASLPCPAEMGASIHISGTASSIVDTVFVCRSTGKILRRWIAETPHEVALLVTEDLRLLKNAGLKPTQGDIRCLIYGHMVRLTIWNLRRKWDASLSTFEKLQYFNRGLRETGGLNAILGFLGPDLSDSPCIRGPLIQEEEPPYGADGDEISF
jgi:putative DNA methylase